MKKLLIALMTVLFLSACGNGNYVYDVDITAEQRTEYENQVKEWTDKIKDYKPEEGAEDTRVPVNYFINKARYEDYLGLNGDAVDTLNKALQLYEISSVAWNNLAKLYEERGDYETALGYYRMILDHFPDLTMHHANIIRAYIKLGEKEKAEKYYYDYVNSTGHTDEDLLRQIKEME